MPLNPTLLQLAQLQTAKEAGHEKIAVVPAAGGAPPMDPAMAGGAPPMDPAMAGGAPPMDPAMAGGAPSMDPAMAGGMPPAAPPAAPPGAMPGMPADPSMGATGQKMKPEQMMQVLDFRLYNMQQQITAIMNALDISVPAGALITPPGGMAPPAEAAMPGGPQDPTLAQGPQGEGGGSGQSAISPIEPMQGASPELAMGGGGGAEKQSSQVKSVGSPYDALTGQSIQSNTEALAAMLRRVTQRAS